MVVGQGNLGVLQMSVNLLAFLQTLRHLIYQLNQKNQTTSDDSITTASTIPVI